MGEGVRARGGDLTAKSISSVGGLIEYLCSGVRTFDLFGRETGGDSYTKFKSQVIKGMCIACLLFGILPLGGDF